MSEIDIFAGFAVFENIPLVGALFSGGPGNMPFEAWVESISTMDQLEMMGIIGFVFALLAIAGYSEMFIRAVWPELRGER